MTKLEELSALLVNELHEFNKNIEKLDKINDQLKDTKIKMDVSEYKSIIEAHHKQMDILKNLIERFESRFNAKIDQAKIYPTWAVVVFIFCIVVTFVLVSYMFLK